jgi:hypothetical protein
MNWPQPTARGNFINGFDKYVERDFFGKDPPPDVYWDPKDGRFETYAPNAFRFVDANLPAAGKVDWATNAGELFDKITQQWAAMSAEHRQSAAWDGRQHKWILAEYQPKDGPSCREQYEKQMRYLRNLHTNGTLTSELFNKQAADLWDRYRHCL